MSLVTGGSSGLGRATVERFVNEGSKVMVFDKSEAGQELADTLGDNCLFTAGDVSSESFINP